MNTIIYRYKHQYIVLLHLYLYLLGFSLLIHEFSNKDVTAEHVILAQAILAGTAQGDKSKAQRFMIFVNEIPDAPTVRDLIPRFSQFMKRFKVS
jgi:hypothetical protein